MGNPPDGTSTRSTHAARLRPNSPTYSQWPSQFRQLCNNPFAPSKASEWPDENSKRYWIGPLDEFAADWEEDESVCNTRKIAEYLYDAGDFAGARYVWAQIADHYISERLHTSLHASDAGFRTLQSKQHALDDIARASIGCVLNTYFAQYPNLCTVMEVDDTFCSWSPGGPHRVFRAVVDLQDYLTNSSVLYIMRVMLDYASDIAHEKDHSWMRTVYRRALEATGQIAGLDPSESVRLRQGLVHAIVQSEENLYREGIRANRPEAWCSLSREQQEAHRTQSAQVWKDEVEELYLQIIADQQTLQGITAEATIDSELGLAEHYKTVGDVEKAKVKLRQLDKVTKDHLGEDHDTTLRCMASLSLLLLNTGLIEEAGLVVHDCLTKHPEWRYGLPDMPVMTFGRKLIPRRGWKEIQLVRGTLEQQMSPIHLIWADYRLYTLRTGTVTFVPSYPTDTEKRTAWALAHREPKHRQHDKDGYSDDESSTIIRENLRQQPQALCQPGADIEKHAFSASERDNQFLDLQVPYIPYQHFMTSSAFEAGIPYLEYAQARDNWCIRSHTYDKLAPDVPIRFREYLKQLGGWGGNTAVNNEDNLNMVEKQENKKYNIPPKRAGNKECVEVKVKYPIPLNTSATDQPKSSMKISSRP